MKKYKYIVTFKYERNKKHDPKNKKRGECKTSDYCSDRTGSHHSILVESTSMESIKQSFYNLHITRIEIVSKIEVIP